ncbi:MAG: glycosyl hydrolase [Rhodovulum sulfidophilum]|uniref:Beta-D-glucoside glucohydrolase n=1 Tax=Rhodovulum sulfidophilum TaxID=35806 RepID=A0A2W5N430_RHOSU|nr:MAG: glycosyl hydrolase [Rhodovulum sulfidophilum]
MTLDEKVDLVSGRGMWRSRNIDRLGIPSILMTDGTYGVRYSIDQIDREAGKVDLAAFLGVVNQKARGMSEAFGRTRPATCFPNGSSLGCSWDVELAHEIGSALAAECRDFGVHLLLGPGINTRRTPLAGRAYEYYSEDPIINADLAAGVINGLQENGVGATLKHFACNNSEVQRTTMDSVVDDRALREIYLYGFERTIEKSRPWAVMSSYNRLNGAQASEDPWLLTKVLREDWGYDGLLISDWHGIKDPVAAIAAGSDLDMPEAPARIAELRAAAQAGALDIEALDRACARVLELIARVKAGEAPGTGFDIAAHHDLAIRAARESIVLLRNAGSALPVAPGARIAVIGRAAEHPIIQGSGSATTNPYRVERPLDAIRALAPGCAYAPAYEAGGEATPPLIEEALAVARAAEVALVFVHAENGEDGEGADRRSLGLAQGQDALIARLAETGTRIVVVVASPDAVEMPWAEDVGAILACFFAGQGFGAALADLVFGRANPSGKLSVTFPRSLRDVPGYLSYPGENGRHPYVEGIYVGYRGYEKRGVAPLYPFGHGLSYTSFEYQALSCDRYMIGKGESIRARFEVTNTGAVAGREIAQLYLRPVSRDLARPERELKAFVKLALAPGETRQVTLTLAPRDFAAWDPGFGAWVVEDGPCAIEIGASLTDIRLRCDLMVATGEARHGFVTLETQPKFILAYPKARAAFVAFLTERMSVTESEADRMLAFCVTSFFGIHTTLNYFFKQSFGRAEIQGVIDAINSPAP